MLNREITWYQWEEKTLERAKTEHKSIFLFIDDHTSIWSKKMREDSFSDDTIIELLNERFIAIKVNRYERPDMERYYQKVYRLMNRQRASSPLTIFLTEELKPFYAGAYLPPKDIDEQLSFESLLRVISNKYITDSDTLSQKGDEVLSYINPKDTNIQATKLNLTIGKRVKLHIENLFDHEFGGFSKEPKFPNTSTLELLLSLYQHEEDSELLNRVTFTLDQMSKGGFYDREIGGFYQYALDQKWERPYEIKTSYDNILLAKLYLRAFTITKDEAYKNIAFKTLDFLLSNQKSNRLIALEQEPIICSWNALMVDALFQASLVDKKYEIDALKILDSTLSTFYYNGTLFHAKDETIEIKAFLEDYAYLGKALISAYNYTSDESFLIMATQFSNLLIEQFYQQAQWIYANNQFSLREDIDDITLPSSLSVALSLLLQVSILGENDYRKFVFKSLELHSFNLMRQPLSSPKLTEIVLEYLQRDGEKSL